MEANPGTVEQHRFNDYRQIGINRLSLGIQSFNAQHLQKLGRIHDAQQAHKAVDAARQAGFNNINLDIMHGLPGQSMEEGLEDLGQALAHQPEHLSWYQLTLEPNTVFYKKKPILPSEEVCAVIEEKGLQLLESHGYARYEISAYSKPNRQSQHNLNYWRFGDYLGIGAGAHGKLTNEQTGEIIRSRKHRQPKDYLQTTKPFLAAQEIIASSDVIFEFMLNASRLQEAIPYELFQQTTLLPEALLKSKLQLAAARQLIILNENTWQVSPLGRKFTNDLQALFLPV